MLKHILYQLAHLHAWLWDGLFRLRTRFVKYAWPKVPQHYLGIIDSTKPALVLIPGWHSTWPDFRNLIKPFSLNGYPVYTIPDLPNKTAKIEELALCIKQFLLKNNLRKVILIGHSRGGLVGKHLLAFHNKDRRILGLVAIAAPFGGTDIAKMVRSADAVELQTDSPYLHKMNQDQQVDHKIITINAKFDNFLWAKGNSHLPNAKNVTVNARGHSRILYSRETKKALAEAIKELTR